MKNLVSGFSEDELEWARTGVRPSTQLGTAAWQNARQVLTPFQIGDFWIGGNDGHVGFRDDRHVLIVSGTRGGKGTSVLIPNLCMWPGSAVVIDPKGENAIVTARRRAGGSAWSNGMGQKVRILDPFTVVKTPQDGFDDLKACFNPLDELDVGKEESVDTAFRIADALVISEKSNDPFWDDSAKDLLSALLLHVASAKSFTAAERNLGKVCELVTAGDEKLARMAALASPDKKTPSGHWFLFMAMKGNTAFDGVVARAGSIFADLEEGSPRTFASVVQVLRSNLKFLESPAMKRITRASNFRLSDVKTDAKGVTLYLCLPQRFMESHARWLRMMTTLLLNEMERTEQQPACGHPILTVLDEFPALQRMRSLENAAAQIAGYGVKLVFVTQTLAQLKDIYKDNWETLLANAGVKLFFCNDDHFTRDYVSKLIGDREVQRFSESVSETKGISSSQAWGQNSGWSRGSSYSASNGNGSFGWNQGRSGGASFTHTVGTSHSQTKGWSSSVHKRPLVTPDEVGRLFGNRSNPKALVLVSGHQPISVDRVFYHRSPIFRGRYDWHPDHAKPLRLGEPTAEEAMASILGFPRDEEAERVRKLVQKMTQPTELEHPGSRLRGCFSRFLEWYHTLLWSF